MSPRLLLVEDDEVIRTIASISLGRLGEWEVRTAVDGREALEMAERERFDVVLLDVMMPGLDGPATLRLLRDGRLPAVPPVIFMTAKTNAADCDRLLALGAAGIIAKPFDPMTLAEQVQSLLDGQTGLSPTA